MSRCQQLDLSQLEPPVPMEKALEAVDLLPDGHYLRMLFPREPVPLFMLLDQSGMVYRARSGLGATWEVLAWHEGDQAAEQAALAEMVVHE